MERERPEYLPPIQGRRWEFPWMVVIGVALMAIMAGGVSMLARTNAAWAERFDSRGNADTKNAEISDGDRKAYRKAIMAEIRRKREQAEMAAKQAERVSRTEGGASRETEVRCISGTVFRRIPGGWENVPGQSCQR